MKTFITTPGSSYIATVTAAATITATRDGRSYTLCNATEAGQWAFTAISDSVDISDDAATLNPNL